ncbi:MAG: hypothetical protein ACM34L_12980, partial [Gemmatimonas sp.]
TLPAIAPGGVLRPLPEPFSWSPATGWRPFTFTNGAASAVIFSLNSHGVGVGIGVGPNSFNSIRAILYDVAAGIGDDSPPSHFPFDNIGPTGINDSNQISANADFVSENGTRGSVALVNGQALPPGIFGDGTAGINSAGVVGGQSNGLPVLWVPNP